MKPSFRIKTEYSAILDKTLCHACLSSDRKLYVLGDLRIIFRQICYNNAWEMHPDIRLCWECRSVLVKVKNFQERVEKAQTILNTSGHNENPPKSLSTLLVKKPFITDPDGTIENNEIENKYEGDVTENKYEGDVTDVKQSDSPPPRPVMVVKEEPETGDFNDDFDSFDYVPLEEIKEENLADTLLKELKDVTIEKIKLKITKKPKDNCAQRTRRYKMTHQNNDNAVEKIAIDENELDSWLERERNSKYYENLKSKCDKCISGTGKDNLKDHHKKCHVKSKTMAFYCLICQQYFPSELALSTHTGQHYFHYSCMICGYECYNKWNIRDHMMQHSRIVQCLECPATFSNTRKFFVHYKDAHRIFICDYCNKKYKTKSTLEGHIYRKHTCHRCEICNISFSSYRTKKDHYNMKHRIERTEASYCVQCNIQFDTVPLFRRHINSSVAHLREKKVQKHTCHRCEICNISFSSYRTKKDHYNMKHRIERTEASYCVQCNIQFDTVPLFRRHINSSVAHLREKKVQPKKVPVPCPSCPNVYARKTNMMNHYRQVHAKASNYYCTICEKPFLNRTRYKDHMMYLHEGLKKQRNKICYVCGRGFYDNRILTNHVRTHTGERPFHCEQCDARFAQKAALNTHVKFIHMKSKRRPDTTRKIQPLQLST